LAADADAGSEFCAFRDDFEVVFAGFGVGHADDVPADVKAFVCAQSWTIAAYADPVGAFCRHVVVAENGDVSVHFGVCFSNDS